MTDLLYSRQKDLELNQIPSAIVVGCGGTGSEVARLLAMSGCLDLSLFDADRLEIHNFNRLCIPAEGNLGRPKTEAIAEYIKLLRPDCQITTYGKATVYNLLEVPNGEYLFDCTDSQETQIMLCQWAKDNNRIYIRCGYDGTHVTICDSVPQWQTSDKPTTGYEIRPSWVVPATLAACFAVSKAMYASDTEVRADLKDFQKGYPSRRTTYEEQIIYREPMMRLVTITEEEYKELKEAAKHE